eukprot:jgi/Antlo1/79/1358
MSDAQNENNFSLYRSPTTKICQSPLTKAFSKKRAPQILKEQLLNRIKTKGGLENSNSDLLH